MTKKIGSLVLLLCTVYQLQSQELYTLSVLTQVPQSSYANPALVPNRLQTFIGVPLLSGIQLNSNSRGFSLNDIGWTNLLNPSFDYPLAQQHVSADNQFRTDSRLDYLYGGVANKSGMFSFNFSERIIGGSRIPGDFFHRLADEDLGRTMTGRRYDLSSLSGEGLHFKELGMGYATQKRKGVNWGFRLKFLLGHEGFVSKNDGLMLSEQEGGSLSSEGSILFQTAGFESFSAEEKFFKLFSARNAGVALDAGFHYRYNKKWEFFGSIRDLGGITWRKSLNLREVTDISPDLMSEMDNTFQSLINERAETTKSFRTSLPTQLRGGMRYHFKNKHTLNALASARFYQLGTDVGLSLAYHIPVSSNFEWTASYSIFNQTFTNVGTGFSVRLGKLQWYFATDNVFSAFSPTSAQNAQFQTGINLLWEKPEKKHKRPTANRETIQPEDPKIVRQINEATPDEEGMYFTLNSLFTSSEGDKEVNAIYVDIYRYLENGEKQLIHTSRYPSDQFEVTLYRIHSLHELSVQVFGFEPLVYQFFPESDGLERAFKLTANTTSDTK